MGRQAFWVNATLCLLGYGLLAFARPRSFTIDYKRNTFLKDGEPFRYISGSIHYFRVPYQLWADRLQTMRAAGLNAIQTYVEWRTHEPENGKFSFEGHNDIVKFVRTAESLGLLVLLRLGPYIDAERDMGGLPYWLMSRNQYVLLRTSDPTFLRYVDRYYKVLLPLLRPLLYCNGGPVIMLQIENEYGSYPACDFEYTSHLRDLVRQYVCEDVLLYSTDGCNDGDLKCGKNDGVYTTVDFGAGKNVSEAFAAQRRHQYRGPLVNSEFYTGWLDMWGSPHANVNTSVINETLQVMLRRNASVNLYMFHGGTSFGFGAGAVPTECGYRPVPTSYDYDAPVTEAGDPTPKYLMIREIIGEYLPLPGIPVPRPKPKMSLKSIRMNMVLDIERLQALLIDHGIPSVYPLSFEDVNHGYGMMLYTTVIGFRTANPGVLRVPGLRDRGYIYVDHVYRGLLSRMDEVYEILLPIRERQNLTILVENQGRVSVGAGILDRKGIITNVTLGSRVLRDWTMTPIPIDIGECIRKTRTTTGVNSETTHEGFGVYSAEFTLPLSKPLDTFLRLDGWKKGFAYLNGHCLGRYWPERGPQVTLYVPSVFFQRDNLLQLVELEEAPCGPSLSCSVSFVSEPEINGPVPDCDCRNTHDDTMTDNYMTVNE